MRKVALVVLLACAATMSVPAAASASGNANCAGQIASNSVGMPPFVADLMAGFGRLFGFLVSHDCDIPGD